LIFDTTKIYTGPKCSLRESNATATGILRTLWIGYVWLTTMTRFYNLWNMMANQCL